MKSTVALVILLLFTFHYRAQIIEVHVKKLDWVDRNLETNEEIDRGSKECDANYSFDLKKRKLHYINKKRNIDKFADILDFNVKDGIYSIQYKDVYRFDESIVWYPTAIIDIDNHKMQMVFPEPPRELIGYDNFTEFDLKIK